MNTFGLDSDTSNDSSKTAHSKSVWMEWMRNLLKDNQVTEVRTYIGKACGDSSHVLFSAYLV